MPKIDLTPTTLTDFQRRVNAITSTDQRQWGTMTTAQMFAHLRIGFEISNEERESINESREWLLPIVWYLMFELFTNWPHGKIKASRQFLDDTADDLEAERTQLLDTMSRFVEKSIADPDHKVLEPMLGHISLKKWQRLHGVHTDYHLRQFDN